MKGFVPGGAHGCTNLWDRLVADARQLRCQSAAKQRQPNSGFLHLIIFAGKCLRQQNVMQRRFLVPSWSIHVSGFLRVGSEAPKSKSKHHAVLESWLRNGRCQLHRYRRYRGGSQRKRAGGCEAPTVTKKDTPSQTNRRFSCRSQLRPTHAESPTENLMLHIYWIQKNSSSLFLLFQWIFRLWPSRNEMPFVSCFERRMSLFDADAGDIRDVAIAAWENFQIRSTQWCLYTFTFTVHLRHLIGTCL